MSRKNPFISFTFDVSQRWTGWFPCIAVIPPNTAASLAPDIEAVREQSNYADELKMGGKRIE